MKSRSTHQKRPVNALKAQTSPLPNRPSAAKRLWDRNVGAFWTSGLAFTILFVFQSTTNGIQNRWGLYALVFLLGAGISLAGAIRHLFPEVLRNAAFLVGLLLATTFLFRDFQMWTLVLAAAQTALAMVWVRPRKPGVITTIFLATWFGWHIAVKAAYMGPWDLVLASAPAIPWVCGGALLTCTVFLFRRNRAVSPIAGVWIWIVSLGFLIPASILPSPVAVPTSYHHYGVFVGPVEMLRQGGRALWDVPSQYGLLNMWIASILPIASSWTSVFVLNTILLAASAGLCVWASQRAFPGKRNLVLAICVTVVCVFSAPGFLPSLSGPYPFPSLGAMRFFWCELLLALGICFVDRRVSNRVALAALFTCWALGCLWSAESSFYCTLTLLPAILFVANPSAKTTRRFVRTWRVPVAVVLLAAFSLHGHGVDWRVFADHAMHFGTGSLIRNEINPRGAIWISLAIFMLLAVQFDDLREQKESRSSQALVLSAALALFATETYFVGNPIENNVVSLAPVFLLAIVTLFYTARVRRLPNLHLQWMTKAFVAPLLVVILTVTLGHPFFPNLAERWIRKESEVGTWPRVADGPTELLRTAGVALDAPLVWNLIDAVPPGMPVGGQPSFFRPWLPVSPLALLNPLSVERRRIYAERYIDRVHPSGWLLEWNQGEGRDIFPFREVLSRTHRPTRTYQNSDWTLTWYEYGPNRR